MRNLLLLTHFLLLLTVNVFGQTPPPPPPMNQTVTGNLIIDAAGTTYDNPTTTTPIYKDVPNIAGDVNIKGDLVFTGTNPWILHTPNDGRTSLYLAPTGLWGNQTRFDANGDVTFSHRVSIGDVTSPGALGINTLTLAVGGRLGARSVHVVANTTPWPDYVFSPTYALVPLGEVARYVGVHHPCRRCRRRPRCKPRASM